MEGVMEVSGSHLDPPGGPAEAGEGVGLQELERVVERSDREAGGDLLAVNDQDHPPLCVNICQSVSQPGQASAELSWPHWARAEPPVRSEPSSILTFHWRTVGGSVSQSVSQSVTNITRHWR